MHKTVYGGFSEKKLFSSHTKVQLLYCTVCTKYNYSSVALYSCVQDTRLYRSVTQTALVN